MGLVTLVDDKVRQGRRYSPLFRVGSIKTGKLALDRFQE